MQNENARAGGRVRICACARFEIFHPGVFLRAYFRNSCTLGANARDFYVAAFIAMIAGKGADRGVFIALSFLLLWGKGRCGKVSGKIKYTRKALREAVAAYFDSITRVVEIQEKVDSGKKDAWGHVIWDTVPVMNNLGKVATRIEFLVPPTIGGLCLHLGIHSSTWSRWRDGEKHPEFQEIIELVYDRLITWRQEQVVSRDKVQGLIWDLETNYGAREKVRTGEKPDVIVEGLPEEFCG